MPVRANGYYADPALDDSFNNLAKAFAGPTGTDVYAYAHAKSENEKAARIADLFANPNQPDYDRKNIAAGNYAPTSSFYAQDQNDATKRRDADLSAKTQTDVAGINNAGALARTYAAPIILSDGQTANLPAQTQAATGLPSMFRGNVTNNPGQTTTTPTGEVIKGADKPMTSDELKARILNQQPASDQRAVVMAPADVAAVVGPDGNPVNTFKADSVGKQPYEKDSRQPQLGNYKGPDGKVGTAVFNKDTNKWNDTQTGAELPEGIQIVAPPGTQVNIDSKAPNAIEDGYGKAVVEGDLKPVIEAGASAQARLGQIGILRDAATRAGDNITTGPFAGSILKAKQALGGLFGNTLDGVPEGEVINNIGYKLASEAARGISSRPTQTEFAQALAVKPGLAMSKEGMHATLGIMEQNAHDDQALAQLATIPANRQNWPATRDKYYAEHPIMSPFDPSKPLGKADIDRLEAAAPNAAGAPAPTVPAKAAVDPTAVEAEMRRRGLLK